MEPCIPDPLPIQGIDWSRLVPVLGAANRELARYDGLLHGMQNPAVLLSPITKQEAVLSSKIEGTQATLEDVLMFEADEHYSADEEKRRDIAEIRNYWRALRHAEKQLKARPFHLNLMLELHAILLDSVRGRDKQPGRFRTTQNWIGPQGCTLAEACFVPPSPLDLPRHLTAWENYYHVPDVDPLAQLAVMHAQFEVLHPFADGNGRIGRILIPLFLHEQGVLSQPMFYLSAYLEAHRDTYIQRLRELQSSGGWMAWLEFFLEAVRAQALSNAATARQVIALYDELKREVIQHTRSQHAVPVLDGLFERPVISPSDLARMPDMPSLPTISQMLKTLAEHGVVKQLRESQGRRPALYVLSRLVNLCEGREVF